MFINQVFELHNGLLLVQLVRRNWVSSLLFLHLYFNGVSKFELNDYAPVSLSLQPFDH